MNCVRDLPLSYDDCSHYGTSTYSASTDWFMLSYDTTRPHITEFGPVQLQSDLNQLSTDPVPFNFYAFQPILTWCRWDVTLSRSLILLSDCERVEMKLTISDLAAAVLIPGPDSGWIGTLMWCSASSCPIFWIYEQPPLDVHVVLERWTWNHVIWESVVIEKVCISLCKFRTLVIVTWIMNKLCDSYDWYEISQWMESQG